MNNWVTIISYNNSQDAHMVKNYLESEGVAVFLKDDMAAQVASHYSHAMGGVKLLVTEEEYDNALDILVKGGYIKDKSVLKNLEVEIVEPNPTIAKNVCPFCRSTNVEKAKHSDPVQNILYFILGAIFPILRRPYKCNDCKRLWKYRR